MEVQKEAQRIMTMSVWKMYHSRMQRGGLRLHRSLQLSLVMRNARDLYLSAKLEEEEEMAAGVGPEEGFAAGRHPDLDLQASSPQHLEAPPPASSSPPPPPPRAPERLPQAQSEAPLPSPQSLATRQPLPALAARPEPEPMETQEEPRSLPAPPLSRTRWSRGALKPSRKRRSSSLGKIGAAEAGLVPSKKAKLAEEEEGERQPQRQEGPFPTLARVLQDRFSGLILSPPATTGSSSSDDPKGSCRQGDGVLSIMVRAVMAF